MKINFIKKLMKANSQFKVSISNHTDVYSLLFYTSTWIIKQAGTWHCTYSHTSCWYCTVCAHFNVKNVVIVFCMFSVLFFLISLDTWIYFCACWLPILVIPSLHLCLCACLIALLPLNLICATVVRGNSGADKIVKCTQTLHPILLQQMQKPHIQN